MAKAVFQKHQRVFVRPVGTWAMVEQVKPQWVKDVEEPVKVFYDCGLGRDFSAAELAAYDRHPNRIEAQARLVANAPRLLALAEALVRLAGDDPGAGDELLSLARRAKDTVRAVKNTPQSDT